MDYWANSLGVTLIRENNFGEGSDLKGSSFTSLAAPLANVCNAFQVWFQFHLPWENVPSLSCARFLPTAPQVLDTTCGNVPRSRGLPLCMPPPTSRSSKCCEWHKNRNTSLIFGWTEPIPSIKGIIHLFQMIWVVDKNLMFYEYPIYVGYVPNEPTRVFSKNVHMSFCVSFHSGSKAESR